MGLLDKYTAKYDSVATHSNLDTSLVSADKKDSNQDVVKLSEELKQKIKKTGTDIEIDAGAEIADPTDVKSRQRTNLIDLEKATDALISFEEENPGTVETFNKLYRFDKLIINQSSQYDDESGQTGIGTDVPLVKWMKDTDWYREQEGLVLDPKGKGVYNEPLHDETGEVYIGLESAYESDPMDLITNYVDFGEGLVTPEMKALGKGFLNAKQALDDILTDDPSVYQLDAPIINLGMDLLNTITFGASPTAVNVPGGTAESAWDYLKPDAIFGGDMKTAKGTAFLNDATSLESIMDPVLANKGVTPDLSPTSNVWKELNAFKDQNPGKIADAVEIYQNALVDALPFFDAVRNQNQADIVEFGLIKNQFDPDNPNLSDEAKKYMELKQSQFQAKEYLESYDIK